MLRQLGYCLRGAESDGDQAAIAQVKWWIEKVAELRKQQPSADPAEKQGHLHLQPTGTGR